MLGKKTLALSLRLKPSEFPSDLTEVIDAWPTLPEAIRLGIVAMVKASGGGKAR